MGKISYFSKKILLVDDSTTIRQGLSFLLKKEGYNDVDTAVNGLDAKSKLLEKKYDLVITDFDMPEMNGGQLLKYIKSEFPGILVIMLSAQADIRVIVDLMQIAENYFIKDDINKTRESLFYIIEQTFEKDRLIKENKRLFLELKEKEQKTSMELQIAQKLIEEVLPKKIHKPKKFKIKIFNRPSAVIGGDFYYSRQLDKDNTVFLIADICGHGIPAALFLFSLKTAIDEATNLEDTTDGILKELNSILYNSFPGRIYATVSCLIINDFDNSITFSNAFQNPILYLKNDGTLKELTDENIRYIGAFDEAEFFYKTKMQIKSGERLYLYTDGITEAKNKSGQMLGISGVKKIIKKMGTIPLEDSVSLLYKTAQKFSKEIIDDDITIIGIEAEE